MKLRKITAIALLLAIMIPFLASCTEAVPTPSEVWNEASTKLAQATNLSFSAELALGKYKVSVDYATDRSSGARSYLIKSGEQEYPIYTDGTKNYYTTDELSFCVKSAEDTKFVRDFMKFNLANAADLQLTDEIMKEAAVEIFEDYKVITFKLGGNDLKALFAKNEDVTFTEGKISAKLDLENNIKSLIITTTACGNDFYSIPLLDAKNEAKELIISVNNIDFSAEKAPKAPENADKYEELPLLAYVFPTAFISNMKDSSSVNTTLDLDIDLILATMSSTVVTKTVTQTVDGITSSRTFTTTTSSALGQESVEKEDAYKNGKDNYTYYTDPENGNYKILEDEDEDEQDENPFENLKPEDFLKYMHILTNAEISGSRITIKISEQDMKSFLELAGDLGVDEDSTGIGLDLGEVTVGGTEISILLNESFIESITFGLSISTQADLMGTGQAQKISVSLEAIIKYDTPLENYTVVAPEGYESYEDWT